MVAQNVTIEFRMSEDVAFLGSSTSSRPWGYRVASRSRSATPTATSGGVRASRPSARDARCTEGAEIVLRYVSVGEQIAAHEVTMPITVNLVSADEAAAARPTTRSPKRSSS
jgi:hypothetical protein